MQLLIEVPNKNLENRVLSLIDSLKKEGVKIVSLNKDKKSNTINNLKKFRGLGKEIYKDINSDEYIKKLRDEW